MPVHAGLTQCVGIPSHITLAVSLRNDVFGMDSLDAMKNILWIRVLFWKQNKKYQYYDSQVSKKVSIELAQNKKTDFFYKTCKQKTSAWFQECTQSDNRLFIPSVIEMISFVQSRLDYIKPAYIVQYKRLHYVLSIADRLTLTDWKFLSIHICYFPVNPLSISELKPL